jgi:hypothetical protein
VLTLNHIVNEESYSDEPQVVISRWEKKLTTAAGEGSKRRQRTEDNLVVFEMTCEIATTG